MIISGKAKLAGVVGWPVAHSLSPLMHSRWLAELGIDGAYVPLAVRPDDFAAAMDGLRKSGFAGVNVTVPHKQAAFALAQERDDAAEAAGAVNLLTFTGGKIAGHNTDIAGLATSLREGLGHDLAGANAMILGSGGAARAAVLAIASLGAHEIRIVARNDDRAAALAKDLNARAQLNLRTFRWTQWPQAAADAALILNATSAGMVGNPPLVLSLDPLPNTATVCDIVYNPLRTDLLERAAAAGYKTIDGLGMLMHQAVQAFAAFYGVEPKVTPALRTELEKALARG